MEHATGNKMTANYAEKQKSRVLIVDDEAAILFAYKRLLRESDYLVDTCETLDAAIQLIANQKYVVIITDLRLSGSDDEDGLKILSFAHSHQPESKVIVVTGYGLRQECINLGASFYFKKPVEPFVIIEALRHVGKEMNSSLIAKRNNLLQAETADKN